MYELVDPVPDPAYCCPDFEAVFAPDCVEFHFSVLRSFFHFPFKPYVFCFV